MNNGGDAAEQIVRLSLEGFEVAVRLTGSAAKNIAILLASVLKQEISQSNKTRGKARLTNMIKSGKELKVFSFQQKDLPKFTEQAKRYGVLYCVLRDKNTKSDTAMVDIIARAEDAAKIQRISDRFELGKVDKASEVVQSPEKFKAYLDVQSRMDRYTANNALLMYKQFPQASQIKEFDDWAAEGVKVNKGSKTFIILDPYEYTKKDGTIGIDFNLKRVLDVSQTNGKRPAAPTANRDPRKLVAVMLDSAPINIESVSELPYPDMGAFYKNEDQTLYVKRDIGDSVALCQCVAQELGHAELSMNSEVYSRRDMGFQAVCIGYMLCKKYGVDTQNFAIDRIPDELKNKEPKDIKAELGKTQKAFKEITARVSDELYRQRAERSKEQER